VEYICPCIVVVSCTEITGIKEFMDKIIRLKSSINPIISLTDEEYRIFSHVVKLKTLGKNEFLLEEGRICDFIGLVNHIKINR